MPDIYYLLAVMMGLLGSSHCVGMCGGIVNALTLTLPQHRAHSLMLLAYNGGRIVSYAGIGCGAGAIGASAHWLAPVLLTGQILYGFTSLMLFALGLYLTGWWRGLLKLEQLGAVLWHRLQPLSARLLPVRTVYQAWFLGMLWGFLPCGLVYSALAVAVGTGNSLRGCAWMLAFGVGTLPTLLLMGKTALAVQRLLQQRWVRTISGLVFMLYGAAGLTRLLF